MYSKFQLARKYLYYYLTASNAKGHGVHSPFVFEFITQVLNDKRNYYCYDTIEKLRRKLKADKSLISIKDFGAGSRVEDGNQRTVSSIAKFALKPKKFSQLLFRVVNYYQPKTILELGTSLGITTSYLASGNINAKVITLEGASAVAKIAKQNFEGLLLKNIQLVEGNFDETLKRTVNRQPSTDNPELSMIDLAFIDGNHRKEPTVKYFNLLMQNIHSHSILIFDDIHWSKDMEDAWEEIKAHSAVSLTIDLFFIGLVFFRQENKAKQHFAIRF